MSKIKILDLFSGTQSVKKALILKNIDYEYYGIDIYSPEDENIILDLSQDDIVLRMTGCPNGCGRSTAAEIGFVGTAYGLYNLHIGGDRLGLRLNKKFKENLNEDQILQTLDELFFIYANEKIENETFGDFSFHKWVTLN